MEVEVVEESVVERTWMEVRSGLVRCLVEVVLREVEVGCLGLSEIEVDCGKAAGDSSRWVVTAPNKLGFRLIY